jgi:hypothetical protein
MRNFAAAIFISVLTECFSLVVAQTKPAKPFISKVWVADADNGNYKNPVLHADYSDRNLIRVATDLYMVSSSFQDAPGRVADETKSLRISYLSLILLRYI